MCARNDEGRRRTIFDNKARLKRFRICPIFFRPICRTNVGSVEQLLEFVESAEKSRKLVEWNRKGSQIKFEWDQTFAPLPYNFSFFVKKFGYVETV